MRWFRVTAGDMGSVEVLLTSQEIGWLEECKTDQEKKTFLAHQAWIQLWKTDGAKMLQNLCDNLGVDKVKAVFTEKIQIEEIK